MSIFIHLIKNKPFEIGMFVVDNLVNGSIHDINVH